MCPASNEANLDIIMVEVSLLICTYILLITKWHSTVVTAMDRHTTASEILQLPALHSNQYSHHVQWLCYNLTTKAYDCSQITCSQGEPSLAFGYCATYSEDTRNSVLSVTLCPYFQSTGYNMTTPGYIQLPRNLTQLNDYMCGPLNRKGLVCSECADGFGPAVNSFWYTCANCTDAWYKVPLFLIFELVPITVFYLIILAFQIGVTSAPLPCFIMYAQMIVVMLHLSTVSSSSIRETMFTEDGDLRMDMKVIHTLYGVFNLDFSRYLLPQFCISSKLKFIHMALLGYISVFYPMLLICLTLSLIHI